MSSKYTHGVFVEFIKDKTCNHCKKIINQQPAIAAFLYRTTPAAQSSYYHLKCVKKIKPVVGSGVDRVTGESFYNKLHYSFSCQNSCPTKIKVNIDYINNILKLNQQQLFQLCLKSPFTKNHKTIISAMPSKIAKSLGMYDQQQDIKYKAKRRVNIVPISNQEILEKLDKTNPNLDLSSHHPNHNRLLYNFRVRKKQIHMRIHCVMLTRSVRSHFDVAVNAPFGKTAKHAHIDVYLDIPSRDKDSKNLNKQLLTKLKQKLCKTSHFKKLKKLNMLHLKNKKLFEEASKLHIDFSVDDNVRSIQDKMLKKSLTKIRQNTDENNISDLALLLLSDRKLIRKLASAKIKKLTQVENKKPNKTIDSESLPSKGDLIESIG